MRDYGPALNDLRRALGGVLARSLTEEHFEAYKRAKLDGIGGTPRYMPPEQHDALQAVARARPIARAVDRAIGGVRGLRHQFSDRRALPASVIRSRTFDSRPCKMGDLIPFRCEMMSWSTAHRKYV